MDAEMTEDQKRAAIKDLLLGSNEDEGNEVRKRNADNFARAKRKRDAMLRDPLESYNSKEEDESGEEGKKKEKEAAEWNKNVTVKDLLEGSYDKEDVIPG